MDSTVIEVALALAVVFALVATVADGINEVITRSLNTRSKAMWATIARMMSKNKLPSIGLDFIFKAVSPKSDKRPKTMIESGQSSGSNVDDMTRELATSSTIRALDYVQVKDGDERRTKVSYIPGKIFAAALLEIAETKKKDGSLQEKVKKLTAHYEGTALGAYLAASSEELAAGTDEFLDSVGSYFDMQMDRLTKIYRRNAKWALGMIGLTAALVFNIDALAVASALNGDAQIREAVVVLAGDINDGDVTTNCSVEADEADRTLKCAKEKLQGLQELGLPVIGNFTFEAWKAAWTQGNWAWASHVAGILITALAVALGGPFWWDFLRWLTGVRRQK